MNKFKNSNGQWITRNLFIEMADMNYTFQPIYTLQDEDHKGFRSLYQLYMAEEDPAEFTFSTRHLGGPQHLEELCKCNFFAPLITRWREDLELKIRSQALAKILEVAKNDSATGFQASKFLLEGNWKPKEAVGRPSKAKIKQEAEQMFKQSILKPHEAELLGLDSDLSLKVRN